jgi:AsmA protein
MKRVLLVAGGLLIVGLAAVVLYLAFADLGRFRPLVETAVKDATGRELRIAGEFRPKVFPSPSLVVADVTLANADWGASTPMVSIGRLTVKIGLWSLVSGPIRIRALELRDVAVLLEQNSSGAANWSMTSATAAPSKTAPDSAEPALPVIIERAAISHVDVVWRRPEKADVAAALTSLDLRTEGGSLVAKASGRVDDLPFSIDAKVPAAALQAGADVPIDVAADLDFAASERVAAAFAAAGLEAANLKLQGTVILGPDRYELRDTTAKLPAAEARVAAVVRPGSAPPIKLDVAISAPNLAELDATLPKLALTSTATAKISGDKIELEPLKLQLGDSDFAGSLSVALGDEGSITVKGESKLIDLTPLRETAPASNTAAGAAAKDTKPTKPTQDQAASKWLFGEDELPFERLASQSVHVQLAVAELRNRDVQLRNVVLTLDGERGTLQGTTAFDAAHGGSAEGDFVLATAGTGADLSIDVDARDLRLNIASGAVDDPAQIPPVGVSVSLRSKGNSPRALASAANGRVLVTQGSGRIENGAVGLASDDILAQLFSALNPFAKHEKYSNWDCTVLAVKITDGMAVLEPMLAQSEKLMILGVGKVDLHTEKVEVEFNTKPRSGVGLTADMFVTPFVKLGGTLATPGVSLNAKGTVLSGGAAVLTGGLSLLVQGVADRATAEHDQCAKTLVAAGAAAEPASK